MESDSTGHLPDYRINLRPNPRDGTTAGSETGGAGGAGGDGEADQCYLVQVDIALEEIERCAYWKAHRQVPSAGAEMYLHPTLIGSRLGVMARAGGELVGYLPTKFNFLRICVEQGHTYSGTVAASTTSPVATVRISLSSD